MEAQPQLLLLQKTMLVAEGTGRRLVPEANMWFMARPLIEEWMIENLGPEAQIRDTIGNIANVVDRIPRVFNDIEKGATILSEGRVKLHPETVAALKQGNGTRGGRPVLWLTVATVAVLAAIFKFI